MKVRKFKNFRKYFQIILENIKKGKWIYNIKLFKVNLLNKASEGDLAAYVLNGEWDLLGKIRLTLNTKLVLESVKNFIFVSILK